jgi:hypothetical protein
MFDCCDLFGVIEVARNELGIISDLRAENGDHHFSAHGPVIPAIGRYPISFELEVSEFVASDGINAAARIDRQQTQRLVLFKNALFQRFQVG